MSLKLILASASPRRRDLLNQLGFEFSVENSHCEEIPDEQLPLGRRAQSLALQKALAVAQGHDTGLVLGADTIVAIDGQILGKPKGEADARTMLVMLSGKWHSVYTGIALVNAENMLVSTDYEESSVKFKTLAFDEIDRYVKTGEPMDKAGAYGIQGKGSIFVEGIKGCYFNIVGLPLFKLNCMLQKYGINVLG